MKSSDNNQTERSIKQLHYTTARQTDEYILKDALSVLAESKTAPAKAILSRKLIILAALVAVFLIMLIGPKISRYRTEKAGPPQVHHAAERKDVQTVRLLTVKLAEIEQLYEAGDINGLIKVLRQGELFSKLAAARYIEKIGDLRAVTELERLSAIYSKDMPNDAFANAAAKILSRLEAEKKRIAVHKSDTAPADTGRKEIYSDKELIAGWLVDVHDEPVKGWVYIAKERIATGNDGAFEISKNLLIGFEQSIALAVDSNQTKGRLFIWDAAAEPNELEIVVEPMAGLSGQVVGRNSEPVNEYELEITLISDSNLSDALPWQIKVLPQGFFEVNCVPVGMPVRIDCKKADVKTSVRVENLTPGESLNLGQIRLKVTEDVNDTSQWNCAVAGFVIDEDDEPLACVQLTGQFDEKTFKAVSDVNGYYKLQGLPYGQESRIVVFSKGYGFNPFTYMCADVNNQLDIQLFPPGFDWFGRQAPGLYVEKWLNTEPLTLDEALGTVVLLCIGVDLSARPEFIKEMNEIYNKYTEEGLTVIAVQKRIDGNAPEEDYIQGFIAEYSIQFPVAIDAEKEAVIDFLPTEDRYRDDNHIEVPRLGLRKEGAMYSLYEAKNEPTYYVIGKMGVLRAAPARQELDGWIEQLIGE
ncbi:MAG: redoxin domain-containing protein [Sedimentisphaerales bacterium]|nr:redoxin domain-containing protein [Sedimentisphaerales bacterium]